MWCQWDITAGESTSLFLSPSPFPCISLSLCVLIFALCLDLLCLSLTHTQTHTLTHCIESTSHLPQACCTHTHSTHREYIGFLGVWKHGPFSHLEKLPISHTPKNQDYENWVSTQTEYSKPAPSALLFREFPKQETGSRIHTSLDVF